VAGSRGVIGSVNVAGSEVVVANGGFMVNACREVVGKPPVGVIAS